jgi:hypothetical protein
VLLVEYICLAMFGSFDVVQKMIEGFPENNICLELIVPDLVLCHVIFDEAGQCEG